MDSIIKRPKILHFHNGTKQAAECDYPAIFATQQVCHGDVYATDPDGRFVQITHEELKDFKYESRPWDFKPMYALYIQFMANIAEIDALDRDYVLIYELEPEALDALGEKLNLTPTLPTSD